MVMPLRTLQLLLLSAWLTATPGQAARDKPQQVQDLHYGEVLFHFYQEDYFTAISHLMVAQHQDVLQHHRDESQLLLGGLQLSYGMLDQAEKQFDTLLDTETESDAKLHDRVWYYLTKINYQRGNFEKAYKTLNEITDPGDKRIRAELAVLDANINMALGNNEEAIEALKDARAPEGWEEYLRINRGIAHLRAGNIEQGRKTLDKLGQEGADNEELRALRDRANLGLGYELLRAGDAEQARKYLNRVRLQGPFMQSALLGAGWSDVERGDYQQALTPWLHLLKTSSHQPATHEARLAVPYAFGQLGDEARSIYYYEQAIDYFEQEQQLLDSAIQTAEDGTMLSLLSQAETGTSGGWLQDNPTLKGVPSGHYLVDVLSGHNFQESLKDYRDLGYLTELLNAWLDNIDIYYDMVDTRREAYEVRAPAVRQRLVNKEAMALQERWQHYRDLIKSERREGDPLNLATGKEKQQWIMLQAAHEKLAALPDEPRYLRMKDKTEWLQGVLYWQIQADYKARLWEIEKQLAELQTPVEESVRMHQQVEAALGTIQDGFTGYDKRIETLRSRILALLPAIDAARGNASGHIQQLALDELELRKQRLVSYRNQARYALARSYDQLATSGDEQP
jgi:predicted negative regulator of RcsB-dependent stress response